MNNETLLELAKRMNDSVKELRTHDIHGVRGAAHDRARNAFGSALKELVEFARTALESTERTNDHGALAGAPAVSRVEKFLAVHDSRGGVHGDEIVFHDAGLSSEVVLLGSDLAAVIAEYHAMRAVTGPRCPNCGHFMFAEHYRVNVQAKEQPPQLMSFNCENFDTNPPCACSVPVDVLVRDHPAIAKELGL